MSINQGEGSNLEKLEKLIEIEPQLEESPYKDLILKNEYSNIRVNIKMDEQSKMEFVAISKFHGMTNNRYLLTGGCPILAQDLIFSKTHADFKFQQNYWMKYKFGQTLYAQNLKNKFILVGAGLFSISCYSIYRRFTWYMEHSFDLVNPDMEYLINRF